MNKPDPVLDAVDALRVDGIAEAPIGDESPRWPIGDLIFSDAAVLRPTERRGRVGAP